MIEYTFDGSVNLDLVEDTLDLATLAVEGLHGEARVVLESESDLDRGARRCTISDDTEIGVAVSRIFAGYLRRELGPGAFVVRRVAGRPVSAA